jgi:hypothetical protein
MNKSRKRKSDSNIFKLRVGPESGSTSKLKVRSMSVKMTTLHKMLQFFYARPTNCANFNGFEEKQNPRVLWGQKFLVGSAEPLAVVQTVMRREEEPSLLWPPPSRRSFS